MPPPPRRASGGLPSRAQTQLGAWRLSPRLAPPPRLARRASNTLGGRPLRVHATQQRPPAPRERSACLRRRRRRAAVCARARHARTAPCAASFYAPLLESKLGSGFSPGTGYASSRRETSFSVGLTGVAAEDVEKGQPPRKFVSFAACRAWFGAPPDRALVRGALAQRGGGRGACASHLHVPAVWSALCAKARAVTHARLANSSHPR